ncbi:MAG: FtsW/RodA/SpoVE family cell cycle protein [Ruminococcaceae bacterium]|nr:FtsW/RodA/SpoVE family cell cycle protein [Oscillospiraceae bacterium]
MQQARQNTAARQQPRDTAPPGARPRTQRAQLRTAPRKPVQGRPAAKSPQRSAVPAGNIGKPASVRNAAVRDAGVAGRVRGPRRQAVKSAEKVKKKKIKDPNRVRLFNFQSRVDVPMMIIIMVLLVFGVSMMFSAGHALSYRDNGGDSFYYVTRQMTAAGIGLVGMFFLTFLDYRCLRYELKLFGKRVTLTHILMGIAMGLNLLTIPFGIEAVAGQRRWLPIPFLGQFQPSDLMKIAVIVYFAYYIQKHSDQMRKFYDGILIPGLVLMAVILSVISQTHLSLMVIICVVFAVMLFVGGSNLKYLLPICLMVAGVVVFAVVVLDVGYFKERIVFMDPLSDPGDGSYQNYQSALALGSGGIWGKGFGNSSQKYYYLPEAQNDFVYAVLVEEFGLVGGLAVIVLFLIFVFRGFYIARRSEDKFGCLLATGITFQIGLQAFLNLGVNLCCIPNTGISMPFFSFGGTALMLQLWEMGLLLSVSKRAKLS